MIRDSHTAALRVHDARAVGRAHLIGIAGAGMRSLADLLRGAGWTISGSDLHPVDHERDRLPDAFRVAAGHAAANLDPCTDLVVYSDAIPPDNVELSRARELGLSIVSYPQMLGRLMKPRTGLAIAGTHGKSTTAALAARVLVHAGFDPSYVIGATGIDGSSGGQCGHGDHCLIEACEYRENFLQLAPQIAVLLPIEPDHFDYFRSPAQLEAAFARFAALVPRDGLILYAGECPIARRIASLLERRTESFGAGGDCDWRAERVRSQRGRYRFQLMRQGKPCCDIELAVPGKHNVANATAAAALAAHCGVPISAIAEGLHSFRGLRRRLEMVGTADGIVLVDDYAHHPTEVTASLATVREMFPGRRVWCVFQPHQSSRTAALLDEFARSLLVADTIVVADIYRAREGEFRTGEVQAVDLARRCRELGGGEFAPDVLQVHAIRDIQDVLQKEIKPLDVLVTLGAGDIGKIAHEFDQRVRENRQAG